MKLAIVIFRYFPFGGLQRDMLAIAQAAHSAGHQVSIFCGDWQGEKIPGIEVVEIKTSGWFDIAGVKNFVRAFQQQFPRSEFDLLLGFNKMPGLDVYFAGDTCFARKTYQERGFLYRLAPRTRLYLQYEAAVFGEQKFGEQNNTQILSLVEREQPYFALFYSTPPERFHRIPPGISPDHIACTDPALARAALGSELGLAATTRIILCLGSGFHRKGVDIAIESFARFHAQEADAVLLIAGKDKPGKYQELAQRLGVAQQVFFIAPRSPVGDLLHSADLLLHPAREELAGNVILEAMLCNCPVLVSDCCGYAGYVTRYAMGELITTPANTTIVATQIQKLLSVDKQQWQQKAEIFRTSGDAFERMPAILIILEQSLGYQQNPSCVYAASAQEKVVLCDELVNACDTTTLFAHMENLQGDVARELPDRQTLKFFINDLGYYRKWHRGVGWGEIIKNLVRGRPPILGAVNEWQALNRMRALGIPGLAPVAFGVRGKNPARQESFIVTRELANVIQLDHFFSQREYSVVTKRAIITRTAEIARALHGAGINHRDFYLCHFMLDERSVTGDLQITLMDLHRAQLRWHVPERWLVKDLGGLLFSSLNLDFNRRDFFRFLKVYFGSDLRSLLQQHEHRLERIVRRARATYKRDFGHAPWL
jgi:UDP-glucose:(heptosyl)LPS alpha-1,3-glucosyltransferase